MRWGLREVIIAVGVFAVCLVLSIVAAGTLAIDVTNDDAVGAFTFVASLVAYGALAVVIVVASRARGIGSLAADFGLQFRWVDLAIGFGVGIALRVVYFFIAAIVITVSGHVPERGNFVMPTAPLWVILNAFVLVVLVAPFVEELFFRGLVLRATRNRVLRRGGTATRAAVLSVAVSALGFSLMHLYESPDGVFLVILGLSTLLVGAANGMIVLLTGRLGGAIVTHAVFNGIAVALALAFA
jgi:membrane protease YdiL (CAAX protease family)